MQPTAVCCWARCTSNNCQCKTADHVSQSVRSICAYWLCTGCDMSYTNSCSAGTCTIYKLIGDTSSRLCISRMEAGGIGIIRKIVRSTGTPLVLSSSPSGSDVEGLPGQTRNIVSSDSASNEAETATTAKRRDQTGLSPFAVSIAAC